MSDFIQAARRIIEDITGYDSPGERGREIVYTPIRANYGDLSMIAIALSGSPTRAVILLDLSSADVPLIVYSGPFEAPETYSHRLGYAVLLEAARAAMTETTPATDRDVKILKAACAQISADEWARAADFYNFTP